MQRVTGWMPRSGPRQDPMPGRARIIESIRCPAVQMSRCLFCFAFSPLEAAVPSERASEQASGVRTYVGHVPNLLAYHHEYNSLDRRRSLF